MHPTVMNRRRLSGGNISWFKVFVDALWSAVTSGNHPTRRGRQGANPRAPGNAAALGSGASATPAPVSEETDAPESAGSTDQRGHCTRDVVEEENTDIQEYHI